MSSAKPDVSAATLEALPGELTWTGRPQASDLESVPGCAAVYLLLADAAVPVQLATTQHLRRLLAARLLDPERVQHGRADLAEITRGIRWRQVHSAFEGRWWHYRLARAMYPKQYRRLISFGPAWYLHVDWARPIPEIVLTERIWQEPGEFVGPWLTHDLCQAALTGLWDLFDLCRHPEQVQRAPHGQRCAYAEMGRCDAPCDGTAPLEHYVERVRAAWSFVRGAVRPWIDAEKVRMKTAATEQHFEQAAQIKHQLAFAWKWHDRWLPLIRPAEEMNYLLAVPATRRRAWTLFLFWQGRLEDGPVLTDRRLPQDTPPWLAAHAAPPDDSVEPIVRMEQAWLLAHFLQSKEGDASLVEPLSATGPPAGLQERLREGLKARRTGKKHD